MLRDEVKNTGNVLVEFFEDGALAHQLEVRNLVVLSGLNWLTARASNAIPAQMSHMALGAGTYGSDTNMTTLNNETGRVAMSPAATVAGNVTTYSATFPVGTGNGNVSEFGIFNAAQGGTMLARVVFAAQPKSATTSIQVTWTITQSN